MRIKGVFLALAATAGLAACGETLGDQALGGAAIGAGAAVITNNSLAKGAAIGAAGNVAYCQLYPGRCN
ncbi:hypothetical protein [Sulfitobacter sabulilitoris]|uniref:YMGG-like Gly-zipper domain-containing protein n=1 Tax=Sulfitobacter sabulilitoris TaxID=2562655 RepID=A0A5S3PBQ5_9RHOB|nr:hypothetical protein [Sulfitobacter sabulilitoris]TMM50915.1 hypothetical protein FDT80_16830 [Sulfitobacter sabulilitoris]